MRRAARVDSTQADVVAALREAGASVWVIGLPCDLLVGAHGETAIVEVKSLTETKNPKPKKHTPLQKKFMLDWKGGTVATITDAEGARHLVGVMRG